MTEIDRIGLAFVCGVLASLAWPVKEVAPPKPTVVMQRPAQNAMQCVDPIGHLLRTEKARVY